MVLPFGYSGGGGGGGDEDEDAALSLLDTNVETESGYVPQRVWASDEFVFVAGESAGLLCYAADESGQLSLLDSDNSHTCYGVWGDGTYIYAACSTGGVTSYSVDVEGAITLVNHLAAAPSAGSYLAVTGGGASFIFCGTAAGIAVYTVASGVFTFKSLLNLAITCNGVWFQGSNLYAACSTGLKTLTVSAGGVLTEVNALAVETVDVWGDGTRVYAAHGTSGVKSYNLDESGWPVLQSTYDPPYMLVGSVFGDGTHLFITAGTGGLMLLAIDESGNLTYLDADTQGSNTDYKYVACAQGLVLVTTNETWGYPSSIQGLLSYETV